MAVTDLLVPNATLWVDSSGSAALPANELAFGGTWPTGWEKLTYTKEATKLIYEPDVKDLKVQQVMAPVRSFRIGEKGSIETVLAEFALSQLKYAFGVASGSPGSGSAAAASGSAGYEYVSMGGNPTLSECQWGFEGLHVNAAGVSLPVRVFVYKGVAAANVELEFGNDDYTGIPLKIEMHADTTKAAGAQLFKIIKMTAAAL